MDKTGWTKVKLGDIIIKMPKANHAAKDALDEGKYPFFTNSASDKNFYIDDIDYKEPIILANTGGKAYFKYCDIPCGASRDLYVFKTVSGVQIKYLYYYLKTMESDINEFGFAGAALKHLQKDYLHNIDILIPAEEIQQKIVKLLSTIDNIIQSKSDESTKYQNMKTQLMTDIFNEEREYRDTWRTVKLGDICKIKCGKIPAKSSVEDGKYPLFVAGGTDGKYNSYSYDCEAILTSRNGDVGLAKYYNGKFEVSDHTFAITGFDNKEYDAKFIYYWMELNYDLIHGLAHGTGIPGVNTKDLSGLVVQVPSLSEQRHISSLLSQYDMLIEVERESTSVLNKIKSQLMQEIFN